MNKNKKFNKLNISLFFAIFLFFVQNQRIFCQNLYEKVEQFTLENGLEVFLLEDNEDALVSIDFVCKAGFSFQNKENCGFFKLFSRILNETSNSYSLDFSEVQCNSDFTKFSLKTIPNDLSEIFASLSQIMFSNQFSDEIIEKQLKIMKSEVLQNENDVSTFLNAAIDSRIFSKTPWKHDSGIYPPIFKKLNIQKVRSELQNISQSFYVPQNCAIFIRGNINRQKVLIELKNTFCRFYSSYSVPKMQKQKITNEQRKYVFHSPEISKDLTQIVLQYSFLSPFECDLFANILNDENSVIKKELLDSKKINILGNDYIFSSPVENSFNSRLVIQALMQTEQKKGSLNSFEQIKEFLQVFYESSQNIDEIQVNLAKKRLIEKINTQISTPELLFNKLSEFWAVQDFYRFTSFPNENDFLNTVSFMLNRKNEILNINIEETTQKIHDENPFVFVIINSNDFKKNKNFYFENGFNEINEKNSSWYVLQKNHEEDEFLKPNSNEIIYGVSNDNDFFKRNIDTIQIQKLANEIQVVSKQNKNSPNICLLLSINGGKIRSAKNDGFEEIMVNLLSSLIQKEIQILQEDSQITGNVNVFSQTDFFTSSIFIEFEKQDSLCICKAISDAIIFGKIPPALADKTIGSKQYKKRLENGTSQNQIFAQMIKTLYKNEELYSIFQTEKDILQNTTYNQILNEYPQFLDANRYSVILTGNFDDDIFNELENSLGLLETKNQNKQVQQNYEKIELPNKTQFVKINHTFLTDIPKEEAGPQPAILIPTTKFLDPAFFVFDSPKILNENLNKNVVYNAFLYYLCERLNEQFQNEKVNLIIPQNQMDFSCLIFNNVENTKEIEKKYESTINKIKNEMTSLIGFNKILKNIKKTWILTQMNNSEQNLIIAKNIQKGFEQFPENPNPIFYLEEYKLIQESKIEDFIDILDLFPSKPKFILYSKDSEQ